MKSLFKLGSFLPALIVGAVVLACSPKETPEPPEVKVEVPTNLTSSIDEDGNVFLKWKNDTHTTGYEVSIIPVNGGEELTYSRGPYYCTVPKSELEYSTSYNWTVRALIDDKQSGWAEEKTFTTLDKPNTELFMGNWLVAPENVSVIASLVGQNMDLTQMMPSDPGSGEEMTIVISESEDEDGNVLDNQVSVNMGSIPGLPVGSLNGVSLEVDDNTLTGFSDGTEPFNYELEEPLPLSAIPGLSDYLENIDSEMLELIEFAGGTMPDLSTIQITSVGFTVTSIRILASFPDEEDTSKLRFKITAVTTFEFTTSDGLLEKFMAFLGLSGLDFHTLTITAEIDSVREE
jgi:hypothetical protein